MVCQDSAKLLPRARHYNDLLLECTEQSDRRSDILRGKAESQLEVLIESPAVGGPFASDGDSMVVRAGDVIHSSFGEENELHRLEHRMLEDIGVLASFIRRNHLLEVARLVRVLHEKPVLDGPTTIQLALLR